MHVLFHLLNHTVNAVAHILGALAVGATVRPDRPTRLECLNLSRLEALVVTIVPFARVLGNDMCGELLEVIEQEMERPVCTNARRDEHGAEVRGVEDLYASKSEYNAREVSVRTKQGERNADALPGPTSCSPMNLAFASPFAVSGMSLRPVCYTRSDLR